MRHGRDAIWVAVRDKNIRRVQRVKAARRILPARAGSGLQKKLFLLVLWSIDQE